MSRIKFAQANNQGAVHLTMGKLASLTRVWTWVSTFGASGEKKSVSAAAEQPPTLMNWRPMLCVKDFGATGDGVSDDSAALIAADKQAEQMNIKYIYFPPGAYRAPNLGVVGLNYLPQGYLPHTILVGDGQLIESRYRRVVPLLAPSPSNFSPSDLIPSQHLGDAALKPQTSPLIIDIIGDSTCQQADNVSPSELMSAALVTKLREDNPGRRLVFNTRCVGGRGWKDADGVPSADTILPNWYIDRSKPWLDYISSDAPDILILNFGMNPDNTGSISGGAGGIDLSFFKSVMRKISAFAKRPSLIFITPMQPSLDPAGKWHGYPLTQEERTLSAGYLRTYAKCHGYGLLDFNRRMRMVRDGFDPVNQYMSRVIDRLGGQSLPFRFPQDTEGDFHLLAVFKDQSESLWDNASNLRIQIGARADNNLVVSRDRATGNLSVIVNEGELHPIYNFVSSVPAVPSWKDITFELIVKRGRITFIYNGIQIADGLVPMFGGLFTPTLHAEGEDVGAISATITCSVGVCVSNMPSATDADLYRSQSTLGGNTLNHINSYGIATIEIPVIDAARFSVTEAKLC